MVYKALLIVINCYSQMWCVIKAFKRAADSLAKLMDVMREELPDTMAAVRLSGMEISDLTMELSDLGLALLFLFSYYALGNSSSISLNPYYSVGLWTVVQSRDYTRC